LEEIVNKERNKRLDRLAKLKELFKKFDENTKSKKDKLLALGREAGTLNPQNLALQQSFYLTECNRAKEELLGLQSEVRRLEVQIAGQLEEPNKQGLEDQAILQRCWSPQPGVPLAMAALWKLSRMRVDDTVAPKTIEDMLAQDQVMKKLATQVSDLEDIIRRMERVTPEGASRLPLLNKKQELQLARHALKNRRTELLPQVIEEA